MESLLGQFYSKIRGSQEDIASEGLTYILGRSEGAKAAVHDVVIHECGLNLPELTYTSQATGDNLERPDISGKSDGGKECLLIEAKFWASLTDNQPNEYLKRLSDDSVLMFVCPNLRIRSLWDELKKRMADLEVIPELDESKHIAKFTDNKFLIIKSWSDLLEAVKYRVVQENNLPAISDIDQIIGFCETIDNNTFLPITSDELSPGYAKRAYSYYRLLDKLMDELKKNPAVDLKGLNSAGQTWGYRRYCKIHNFGVFVDLNFEYWSQYADTPFWVGLQEINQDNKWVRPNNSFLEKSKTAGLALNMALHPKDHFPYFALYPTLNEPEEVVIAKMAEQILELVNAVKNIDAR